MRGHMSLLWQALRHGSQQRRRREARGTGLRWSISQTEALESRVLLAAAGTDLSALIGQQQDATALDKNADDAKSSVSDAALARANAAFLPAGVSPVEFAASLPQSPGQKSTEAPSEFNKLTVVGESEPNDDFATANPLPLGFGPGEDSAVDVKGFLDFTPPTPIATAEDDGSIPLANATGLTSGNSVIASATIGDGPFGGTSGDYDHFSVTGVASGDVITVDIDAQSIGSSLDSFVGIYNSAGILVAFNDDDDGLDSFLEFTAAAPGDYTVVVRGFGGIFQSDPFDSSSGSGVASTGFYDVLIGLNSSTDFDYFEIELEEGDILGVNVSGGADVVGLFDSTTALLMGSGQDASFIHPAASPLPGGGNAALSWVVDTAGTYFVGTTGPSGSYEMNLRLFRPVLEAEPAGTDQILFLDFDGATIDPSIFGGPFGPRVLSPLSAFLPGWGLTPADEDAVIDAIVASVTESFEDVGLIGNNGDFDTDGIPGNYGITILNSRDHADPFGNPNVSRVIVGGTIGELGISTIGIAQSIDVGNFETSESAVTLLDLLSAPASNPNSLNQYPLGGGASIIDLIGVGVGNITAHEAGHFFGDWHTDQFNATANIMDQGGNLPNTIGIGPDGIFGTPDDVDVDFGDDTFVPNEGFVGTEDTLNVIAFGLSTSLEGLNNALIIDDGEPGFAIESGTWGTGNTGAEGDNRNASTFGGNKVARWTFTDLTPGQYRVSATWKEHPVRATDAPYTLFDGVAQIGTVDVNQQLAPSGSPELTDLGVPWQDLGGMVDLVSDTLIVKLSNNANGYVMADAVRIERVGDLPPVRVIDDGEPGFAIESGSWGTGIVGAKGDNRNASTSGGTKVASWTFASLEPGQYRVSATWKADHSRATDAPFSLFDGAMLRSTVPVNQQIAPSGSPDLTDLGESWQDLVGTFFLTGETLVVKLSNDANGYVMADAVRVERIGEIPPAQIIDDGDPGFSIVNGTWGAGVAGANGDNRNSSNSGENSVARWTFTGLVPGQYRVSATWHPHPIRATDAPYTVFSGTTKLGTFDVNQQMVPSGSPDLTDLGVNWQDLGGILTVTDSTMVVRLTNDADGYVMADAIRVQRVGELPPPQILDDGDPGFEIESGVWGTGNSGVNGDNRNASNSGAEKVASWTFINLSPGQYRVSATWVGTASRASDAPYTIYDGGTPLVTTDVNQKFAPNDSSEDGILWEDLATVVITGDTLVVRLTNDANGSVMADAIRIERV
ncbi:MAG: hypothetical protein KDA93_27290 [Planctomycetaceae bacterium]|nr:hypothetical protein [Planctomycetaceae bacterium]